MRDQLRNYINRYVAIDELIFDKFYQAFEIKTFLKKELLLKEGTICDHKFFILKGLVRSFYIDEDGNEKITQFAVENWWVSNTESFVLKKPSTISIQALEKTVVLSVKRDALERLLKEFPIFERFFRMITENMLVAIQRRYEFYMQRSSKERYEFFVKWIPDFAQRVPQYMIASYLDITPEYLSQLRKH